MPKFLLCVENLMFEIVVSFDSSGVRLVRGIVKDVKDKKIILNDGTEVPYGLLVWSTGVGPSPYSLLLPKSPERQGKYLANLLNKIGKAGGGRANAARDYKYKEPFVYKHLGSMATLGRYRALMDLRRSKAGNGISMAGFSSWFSWRGAYLTRVISWRNRFYVLINWLTTLVFGRDTSKI
ncbi:hypothetical protein ACFX13_006079 [Malus domestica]